GTDPVWICSSRRRHTRFSRDWSSDVCSSDLSDITVRDATLEYLEILKRRVMRSQLSAATLTSYRRDLLEFTTLLGPDTDLDSIEADDLEIALTTLAKSPDRRYRVGGKDRK